MVIVTMSVGEKQMVVMEVERVKVAEGEVVMKIAVVVMEMVVMTMAVVDVEMVVMMVGGEEWW